MMRFVTVLAALAMAIANPTPKPYQNVFKIDISPEEAQQYINNPAFTQPQLSGRTAVLPLVKYNDPRFRTAEAGPTLGHYWKNGHEIENTDDYVEEVYNAAQYHGQDGLGAYAYGYEAPESAKVENRQRSGKVEGAYEYKDGKNDLIKVRYWADGQGFHQEDNIPKVELKPVEEAPDVKAARLAHEKAWKEAAEASRQQPDPQAVYKALNNHYTNYYSGQASVQKPVYVAPPTANFQAREGKDYEAQASDNYQNYAPNPQYTGQPQAEFEDPEPTGPPRGFYYSFEYPVSIIVPKNEFDARNAPVNHATPY